MKSFIISIFTRIIILIFLLTGVFKASSQCSPSIKCDGITPILISTNGQTCVSGCNDVDIPFSDCTLDGHATYYAFQFDENYQAFVISVIDATFTPIISVSYDCFSPFLACHVGSVTDELPAGPNGLVYVKIEAAEGFHLDSDFAVCINAFYTGSTDCYSHSLKIKRPEYPNENFAGPYFPGETVNFCYDINFIVSPGGTVPPVGNNCQWLQGIIPVLSEGWDLTQNSFQSQGPGGANWLPDGIVHYNFDSPQYKLFQFSDGRLGLDWGETGLNKDDPMPAGWFWASPGSGPECTDGSNPDTAWGFPSQCDTIQHVNFCFDLKVKELENQDPNIDTSLSLQMFAFSDGELGCWTSINCQYGKPSIFAGKIVRPSFSSSVEAPNDPNLHVFPNPFQSKFTVNSAIGIKNVELIQAATGKTIFKKEYHIEKSIDINLDVLSGIYILKSILTNNDIKYKVIVAK